MIVERTDRAGGDRSGDAPHPRADVMVLLTAERGPGGRAIELGEMVSASAVQASNVLRDMRELLTNALGGRMRRYETLLDQTMARAMARFRSALAERGYDGAVAVRFATTKIVDGAAELIVYGTGFRFDDDVVDD